MLFVISFLHENLLALREAALAYLQAFVILVHASLMELVVWPCKRGVITGKIRAMMLPNVAVFVLVQSDH